MLYRQEKYINLSWKNWGIATKESFTIDKPNSTLQAKKRWNNESKSVYFGWSWSKKKLIKIKKKVDWWFQQDKVRSSIWRWPYIVVHINKELIFLLKN